MPSIGVTLDLLTGAFHVLAKTVGGPASRCQKAEERNGDDGEEGAMEQFHETLRG